jgi:hypothetical protein
MDTATAASTIPMTAWEQIAVVCIFILFVGVVLAWFSKQSDKWQRFMLEIDEKWRAFNREQRSENNRAVSEVNAAVTNLTTVTQGLVSEVREMREASGKFYAAFEEHDEQAKKILFHVEQQTGARPPKPRLTK